jgi:hypothetical protein
MPAGFGFYNQDRPVTKEQRVLARIQPRKIPTALAESTTAAVRSLAAAKGITLSKPSSGGSSATQDRLILGAAVLAFLLILVFPARLFRRRGRGGEQSPSSEPR